jgi:predicted  nucleic acid-binding Zn-ribbon protein
MTTLADLEQNIGETTKLYEDYVALVKTKIKALEDQLKVFTEDKDKIASSEQELAAKVAKLEGDIQTVSQAKASADEKVIALESELADLKSSSGSKDADLTKVQSELEKANETASAKDAELSKMTGDLGAVKDELVGLQTEKAGIDDKINAVNVQLEALKKRIQDESASLSGPAGTEYTVVEPEVTGQGTEGVVANPNKKARSNLEKQGMLPLSDDQINAYNTTQRPDEKANLSTKILNRIAVLQQKGDQRTPDENTEMGKLQALNIPGPETTPEITGGKTRKRTMSGKKSKTQKRTKNGRKNGGKNGGKKSKTQRRVKKSNRKTRK